MKWQNLLLLTILVFSCVVVATAEEVNLEVDVSLIKPYDKLISGLGGTWRPEFLQTGRFSLGLGLIASISSRFYYETTEPKLVPEALAPDTSEGWKYINDNHIEIFVFDLHAEGRWCICGADESTKWKAWLTLNAGGALNLGTITQFQTQYREQLNFDSTQYVIVAGPLTYINSYRPPDRFDPYVSPGILIGIGNFTVGYRHWFYLDNPTLQPGNSGRLWGSLRVGYRFQW